MTELLSQEKHTVDAFYLYPRHACDRSDYDEAVSPLAAVLADEEVRVETVVYHPVRCCDTGEEVFISLYRIIHRFMVTVPALDE